MPRRNLTLLLCALIVSWQCRLREGPGPYPRYVAEAFGYIDQQALEPPARGALVDGAMRGMVGVLNREGDVHSQYIGPRLAQPFMDDMRQEFGGVGVRIRMVGDPQRLLLVGMPEPGSPAAAAGVRPNDEVLAIDGEPATGMSLEEVVDRMRGRAGEPLVLTVRHADGAYAVDLAMTRAVISVASVVGDRRASDGSWRFRLDQDPRIAHVRLNNFGAKTVSELASVVDALRADGVEALVLDVRDNPGGALDAAIGVSDLFLPAGKPIVEIRGRHGVVEESYSATAAGSHWGLPIVVLVNGDSASASEIVAACLQDDGRAKVGGERSFGKGTVQRLFPIEAGKSYLKLTTSSYWRPSGANIHRLSDAGEHEEWGVRPDPELAVPLTPEERREYAAWRERRDLTVFDADTGEVLSAPLIDPDDQPPPDPDSYEDGALIRAVEHLQNLLDSGA